MDYCILRLNIAIEITLGTFFIGHSLKNVGVISYCISDHNDTNKGNICLNLVCALRNG